MIASNSHAPNLSSLSKKDAGFAKQILQQRSDLTLSNLNVALASRLSNLRQIGSDRLISLSVPTTKDEEWKYLDLAPLLKHDFHNDRNVVDAIADPVLEQLVAEHRLAESATSLATFVNGIFAPQLSSVSSLPEGVIVNSLAEIDDRLSNYLDQHFDRHSDRQDYFSALNTACVGDVAVIFVPTGVAIADPIQLLFVTYPDQTPTISQPRCLVLGEKNSSLILIETYIGRDSAPYFTNAVTEIWLGENAQLNHTRVQREGNASFHIGTTAIAQSRTSTYKNQSISIGANLSRHNLHVDQNGEQTETTLTGLTLISCQKVADTHSAIAHNYPNGSSNQLHKCIVDDRAHAIFNGKILVAKDAQLTNSRQLSRNLLLSSKARVETKPQLEIFADNVKCAHGATVSQIDLDELFYLQSRGINIENAQNLLTYAFAAEAIDKIPVPSLRANLNSFVLARMQALIC